MIGTARFGEIRFGDRLDEQYGGRPAMRPGIQVLVSNQNLTANYRDPSFQATKRLGSIWTANLELEDPSGVLVVNDGETVRILHDGSDLFSGTVDRVRESFRSGNPAVPWKSLSLSLQSFDATPARRQLTAAYQRQDIGAIVRSIVSTHLEIEGITAAPDILEGLEVGPISFPDRSVRDALTRLARISGATWWIDHARVLHFTAAGSPAPHALTDSPPNYRSVIKTRSRTDYANSVTLRGGVDLGAERLFEAEANGVITSWDVPGKIGAAPIVAIDGSIQALGIRGLDQDEDPEGPPFYWAKGEAAISTNGALPPPVGRLTVLWRPLRNITKIARDQTEVDARAALEGGTGLYEAAKSETGVDNSQVVADLNAAELRQRGRIHNELHVEMRPRLLGLEPGQIMPVSLTREAVSGDFLVESVSISDIGNGAIASTLELVDSEFDGGWFEYWRRIAESTADYEADRAQIVTPAAQGQSVAEITDADASSIGDNRTAVADDPYTFLAIDGSWKIGGRYVQDGKTWIRGIGIETLPT